jgi:hypothetical protein
MRDHVILMRQISVGSDRVFSSEKRAPSSAGVLTFTCNVGYRMYTHTVIRALAPWPGPTGEPIRTPAPAILELEDELYNRGAGARYQGNPARCRIAGSSVALSYVRHAGAVFTAPRGVGEPGVAIRTSLPGMPFSPPDPSGPADSRHKSRVGFTLADRHAVSPRSPRRSREQIVAPRPRGGPPVRGAP